MTTATEAAPIEEGLNTAPTSQKPLEEMTTDELAELFVIKHASRKDHEAIAKDLKEELDALEALLLPRFQDKGIQNMKIKGRTLYIERKLWGGAEEDKGFELAQALKLIGLRDLVKETVNTQTLSSWLREQEEELSVDPNTGKKIPLSPDQLKSRLSPILQPFVKISEEFSLKARKG